MKAAVRDRTIGYNPCEGVRLPPLRDKHDRDEQAISRDTFIRQLLPAIPERYRALVESPAEPAFGGPSALAFASTRSTWRLASSTYAAW